MTEPPPVVICDAGPVIHLDELQALDLLSIFPRVLIPLQVREEIERHRPAALEAPSFQLQFEPVEILPDAELGSLIQAHFLDVGEQAALCLARRFESALVLTDDAAARLAARALRLQVQGTLGILLRGLKTGRRNKGELLDLLHDLSNRSTLFFSAGLVSEVIREVERFGL